MNILCQFLPESAEIGVSGFEDLYITPVFVEGTVVIIKVEDGPVIPGNPVEAAAAVFRADIEIEFLGHKR